MGFAQQKWQRLLVNALGVVSLKIPMETNTLSTLYKLSALISDFFARKSTDTAKSANKSATFSFTTR
jgi:hypothetical protein